jgi:hypothetical protein
MTVTAYHDPKCGDLARYFYPDAPADFVTELANVLQDVIEAACPHLVATWQGRCARCGEKL